MKTLELYLSGGKLFSSQMGEVEGEGEAKERREKKGGGGVCSCVVVMRKRAHAKGGNQPFVSRSNSLASRRERTALRPCPTEKHLTCRCASRLVCRLGRTYDDDTDAHNETRSYKFHVTRSNELAESGGVGGGGDRRGPQ